MRSKAFIFTITAMYFVMLFILFLGLFIFANQKQVYNHNISLISKTSIKYLTGTVSDTPPATNGWCITRIIYDANMQSQNQSTLQNKTYCENYGEQRII